MISMNTKNYQKLISYFSQFVTEKRFQKIKALVEQRTQHITVALEEPHKSHNTSAILRSCDAFGVQDIHCITGRNKMAINDAIASGASKWLSLQQYQTSMECMQALKKKGYTLVATSPHAKKSLHDLSVSKPVALFFGTEKEGLTDQVLDAVDTTIAIPMYGFTESFNVSVSIALCLYQLTTAMRNTNINWQLTKEQKDQVIIEWLKASVDRPELLESRF